MKRAWQRRLTGLSVLLWIVLVGTVLYLFVFQRAAVQARLQGALSVSLVTGYLVYLALGAVRGITLVPATSLVLLGLPFFPPGPLFVLTLAGILLSSASIYLFAGAWRLDAILEARHPHRVAAVRRVLHAHELSIIIGWSFFPLVPTDLICYVCGSLRVGFLKCLAGVAIGEGAICAIYIFAGDYALRYLHFK
jgi:uncharacterized membrane protein YdjX (TVP38/TMEM64 family)